MAILRSLIFALSFTGLRAQGLVRREPGYPPLARRLEGNCSSCDICVKAWVLEWQFYPLLDTETVTVTEVYDSADATAAMETVTGTVKENFASEYDKYQAYLASSTTHTTKITGADGKETRITYPTPYLSIEDPYQWQGGFVTGDGCSTAATPSTVNAQLPMQALPGGQIPLLEDGSPDLKGVYFEIASKATNIDVAQHISDEPAKSCKSNCDNPAFSATRPVNAAFGPAVTPALSVAFVTKCEKSVSGAATVQACAEKVGEDPGSGGSTNESPESGSGGSSNENPETAGGGGGNSEQPETGGDSGSGGGSDNQESAPRITTTDEAGNQVIVAGTPTAESGNSGGGGAAAGGGAGGIYAVTNAQGQVVYATYGPGETPPPGALANGQVTLTDAQGSTIIVQGGQLAGVSGEGAGGPQPGAVTVTDERGELVVIQGGTTGTLSVGPNGDTAVIVGTMTATSWVPGQSVPGSGDGEASQSAGLSDDATARYAVDRVVFWTGALAGVALVVGVVL